MSSRYSISIREPKLDLAYLYPTDDCSAFPPPFPVYEARPIRIVSTMSCEILKTQHIQKEIHSLSFTVSGSCPQHLLGHAGQEPFSAVF